MIHHVVRYVTKDTGEGGWLKEYNLEGFKSERRGGRGRTPRDMPGEKRMIDIGGCARSFRAPVPGASPSCRRDNGENQVKFRDLTLEQTMRPSARFSDALLSRHPFNTLNGPRFARSQGRDIFITVRRRGSTPQRCIAGLEHVPTPHALLKSISAALTTPVLGRATLQMTAWATGHRSYRRQSTSSIDLNKGIGD